jgi:hypothetical protein
MKTNKQYNFFSDPGHGWLEVPRRDVKELNVRPSGYSYYSPDTDMLYLEEDLDAGKFIKAYESKHGYVPKLVDVYQERTFIRGLGRCL